MQAKESYISQMKKQGWTEISKPLIKIASLTKWLKHLPRERQTQGSIPACARIFPGSSHTSDFKVGTPVATMKGTWRHRVSALTGWPGVSILWLDEIESWSSTSLCVDAPKIVWADTSLRYTIMLLGRQASKQPTNKPRQRKQRWQEKGI